MKIGIYNPYFDSLGGGEFYCLMLAEHWSRQHEVCLFWDDIRLRDRAMSRFKLDFTNIKFTRNIFKEKNLLKKLILTKQYDLIFFLSDGSLPTSFAKYNILHFQVPFKQVPFSSLKFSRFQSIVCNSNFTLENLDNRLKSKASVIYPPVRKISLGKTKKSQLIFSVGRFTSHFSVKKQEILIEAFSTARKSGKLKNSRLILAGGLMESDKEYFEKLKAKIDKLPIELLPNISYQQLAELYSEAKIYWHAAGFGETNPELMEHFGISTVEAMSAGCVPVVYAAGGQLEIVSNNINGYLWKTIDELIERSDNLLQNEKLIQTLSEAARKKALDYDEARFFYSFDELLGRIRS